jgi:hypothetical protein
MQFIENAGPSGSGGRRFVDGAEGRPATAAGNLLRDA